MAQLSSEPRVADERVRSETLPFLTSLHGDRAGMIALRSGFRVGRDLKGTTDITFAWPTQSEDLVAWVAKEASYGRDVYHRASMRVPGEKLGLGALFVDIDCDSLLGLPEPTIVIKTSPGRGQCYWVLDEPIDARLGERLCRRLFLASGAAVSELQEIPLMRLPGVPNFKYPDVDISVGRINTKTYSADTLARFLPAPPSALQRLEQRLAAGRLAWSGLLRARVMAGGAAVMSLLAFMSGETGRVSQSIELPAISIEPASPTASERSDDLVPPVRSKATLAVGPAGVSNSVTGAAEDGSPETPQTTGGDPLGDASYLVGESVRTFWSRTSEGLASVQGQQGEE